MSEQTEQDFPELDIDDPFPELIPRDALYVVAEAIVRAILGKKDNRERNRQLFERLPSDVQSKVQRFLDGQAAETSSMPYQIRHQYLNYWQQLYDIIGYHKIKYSLLGGEESEEGTKAWTALKTMELDGAFSQEGRRKAVEYIKRNDYPGLLNYLYSREIERKQKVEESLGSSEDAPNNYGEAIAYGEAGILLTIIENNNQEKN